MNTRPGIVLYAPAAIRHEPLPDVVTSLHVLPVTADGLQPGAGTIIVPARLSPRLRCPGRAVHLAGDLVAQDEDLGVFGAAGVGEQGKPAACAKYLQVDTSRRDMGTDSARTSGTRAGRLLPWPAAKSH